jgi:flagellar basal body rod protein FlgG
MAQSARVDVLANNLANVQTPGYRRDLVAFRAALGRAAAPVVDQVATGAQGGGLEATGRALDFAIAGAGFFTVQDPNTQTAYYTRAGNFSLDGAGRLVTADGRFQALSRDGRPIELDRSKGAVRLREDGALLQGGEEKGQLGIADLGDGAELRKGGNNLFVSLGGPLTAAEDARVEQGSLERSSVHPVAEMVEMLKALRALEGNLEMIRFQDSILGRAVNEFGRLAR